MNIPSLSNIFASSTQGITDTVSFFYPVMIIAVVLIVSALVITMIPSMLAKIATLLNKNE